jgi:hypothetical protein
MEWNKEGSTRVLQARMEGAERENRKEKLRMDESIQRKKLKQGRSGKNRQKQARVEKRKSDRQEENKGEG